MKLIRAWTAVLAAFALLVGGLTAGSLPAFAEPGGAELQATDLRANGLANPLGIGGEDPVLSWKSTSAQRGTMQEAYEVRVATDEASLPAANVWSSGKVDSDEQLNVTYGGPDLESQTRYFWQVRVWDNQGTESAWSAPAWFETALLSVEEWQADWIGGPDPAAQFEEWGNYTTSIDFTMDNLVLGVYARATDLSNAYMWQLSVADGTPRFRPHNKVNGAFTLMENKDISEFISAEELATGQHNFTITFDGSTIIAELNGVEIDRRTDTTHTEGYVGFRQSIAAEGPEEATIHSINVTSPTDGVLLDTDFSDGENPFTGGTVTENGLELGAPTEVLLRGNTADPLLRKDFSVDKTVTSARIYASARGVYELSLNGQKVGDEELAPGWTDYNKRIDFQTHDVTDLVRDGSNALGAMLADGWYSGYIASFGPNHYGSETSLIAQLRIDYSDGSHEWITTDSSWKTAYGPVIESDMLMGERYDARALPAGWKETGFNDAAWLPVTVAGEGPTGLLEPQTDEPVRVTEELMPISRTEITPGTWIYNMGQNMVGVAELELTGVEGSTATIRYGEMLNQDGTLYTANLRSAKATDYYTFAETGTASYTPYFTFHGFQYLEITGVEEPPSVEQVTGLVWGSDLPTTGTLETSSDMLNQLQSNITWGQRGNFLSIPTDTPARDERLGWTGDINVFAPTASYNQDTLTFLGKWLVDLRDSQSANGDLPGVAPFSHCCGGGTGWSDAGVTVPHALWKSYGDTKVIHENYDMMTRFMDFLVSTSGPDHVRNHGGYGDWLHLNDATDSGLLGAAYFSYVAGLMSEMAAAVGNTEDADRYAQLSEDVKASFVERYIAEDGTVQGNSQTGYAIAIGMDLVPDELLGAVGEKFVEKIASRDYHLSTGFLGTPWLLPALTATGNQDLAYRLLNNETYPSWGYEVASGATTMWERWDSLRPDGSFGDVAMNSFNHYAYGAVGDWMYQNIGGITATGAGYKTFEIAPSIGGGLTHGKGTFESVYGTISSDWSTTERGMTLDVAVPVNTTATVRIPALDEWSVTEGGLPIADAEGVTVESVENGTVTVTVGSGTYAFSSDPANSGLTVDIVSDAETSLPGETVTGEVHVANTGTAPLSGISVDLAVSGGLEAAPPTLTSGDLAPGETAVLPFSVDLPLVMPPGDVTVTGAVDVTVGEAPRQFSTSATLTTVLAAITLESVTAVPATEDSPAAATVSAEVSNAAGSTISGTLVVDVPNGWAEPLASSRITVPAGGTERAAVVVHVPLTVDAGEAPLTAQFVHDDATLASAPVPLDIVIATPPAEFTDHVDLGESNSEAAHNVTSSGHGGVTVEAGLTRRYSGIDTVGSWFAFDMAVTPNEPFLFRAIETFDREQVKGYDILINGELVDERLSERSESGSGLATYQVLVPDTYTSTGTVNIQFRHNGKGSHDPSIADVWTMPVPVDVTAPSVVLDVSPAAEDGWYPSGATASLTAQDDRDDDVLVEYQVDDGAWLAYTEPVALADGEYAFAYRAIDAAGNTSEAQSAALRVGEAPVDEETEVPGEAKMKHKRTAERGPADDDYTVSMELAEGVNGSLFRLYENGELVGEEVLEPNTPERQSAVFAFTDKPNGDYVYVGELVNSQGATETKELKVKVKHAGKEVPGKPDNPGKGTPGPPGHGIR